MAAFNVCYAQCPSPTQFGAGWVQGGFTITGIEVGTQCAGRAIRVTTNSNVTRARYIYDYKTPADTSKATTSLTHTYTQPGPYYIVQLGVVNGRPALFCNSIQVYPTPKPTFTLSSNCDATTRLTVNTAGLIYGRYLIDWGDGRPPQVYTPGQPPVFYTYTMTGTYQIRVTGEGTIGLVGCNAVSDPQTFQFAATPLPISNAIATVQDNQRPVVTATLPNATIQVRNYIFTKEAVANLRQQNVWRDSAANATERSFCYQVSYRDRCDKTPATNPTVCTIHLNAQEDALRWTGASPFVQAVQNYAVERLDANGQIIRTYNIGTAIQWDIDPNDTDQEVFYRIKATSVTGQTSISNTVKIVRVVQLIVPEAFSPNNDQINDVLELKGQYLKRASFTVFDRWGEVVFFTEDWRKSWDGKSKEGLPLPNGVYSYYLEAVDNKENAFQRRGAVYLLR